MSDHTPEEKAAERAALLTQIEHVFNRVLTEHRAEFGEACARLGSSSRFADKLMSEIRNTLGLLASVDAASVSNPPGENTWAVISISLDDTVVEITLTEPQAPEETELVDEVEEAD